MAIGIDVKVNGVEVAIRRLAFSAERIRALKEPQLALARRILETADELVPRRTGNLAATGKIVGPIRGTASSTVAVQYGGDPGEGRSFPAPQRLRGGRVAYAARVHEGPSSRPFFLRDAYLAHAGEVGPLFLTQVLLAFRKAV